MSAGGKPTSHLAQQAIGHAATLGDSFVPFVVSGNVQGSGAAAVFSMKDPDGNEIGMPAKCRIIGGWAQKVTHVGSTNVTLAKNGSAIGTAVALNALGDVTAQGTFIDCAAPTNLNFEAGDIPGLALSAAAADGADVFLLCMPRA